MVTLTDATKKQYRDDELIGAVMDFDGLSSDTKPLTYEGAAVLNGSSFFEIDTHSVFFFDEASSTWK